MATGVATGASKFKRLRHGPMVLPDGQRSRRGEVREKPEEVREKNGLAGTRLFVLNRMAIKANLISELGFFSRRRSQNSIRTLEVAF